MTEHNEERKRKPQGFATMSAEQRREISKLGGKKISQNREHMAEIGRKGGMKSRKKPTQQ